MESTLQRGDVSDLLHAAVQVVQTVAHHCHVALARRHRQNGVARGIHERLASAEVLSRTVLLLYQPFYQTDIARASGAVNLFFAIKWDV